MPLPSPSELGSQIASSMLSSVQSKYPNAQVTQHQTDIGNAIAIGILTALQTLAVGFGGAGLPAVSPGVGITGVSADTMASQAANYLSSQTGQSGPAAMLAFTGIFRPIAAALSLATVTSVSGFGGQALKVTGVTPSAVANLIMPQLPSSYQSSQQGMNFVMAVATGFCIPLVATGIPGYVPNGGITPGPTVVKFS